MSVKEIQEKLGVKNDGLWGSVSQDTLLKRDDNLKVDYVRLSKLLRRFNPKQSIGIEAIVNAVNQFENLNGIKEAKNPVYLAYMLATAYHETAHTMLPIEEYGKGRGRRYGQFMDMDGSRYKGLNHIYYGRGYVQLTWLTNYVKMTKLLNQFFEAKPSIGMKSVDLVNHPEQALDKDVASYIMILGMLKGSFTGKSLDSCIRYGTYDDFVSARRIINGMDRARHIADMAMIFSDCVVV